jgi:ribosome biogenesis GTPase
LDKKPPHDKRQGVLVAHLGVAVEVLFDADGQRQIIRVKRNSGHVVGDKVTVKGEVLTRLERRSELNRMDARGTRHTVGANLDTLCIVVACEPLPPPGFIDRAIVTARTTQLQPILLINKSDLPPSETYAAEIYRNYADSVQLYTLSAITGAGLDLFQEYFHQGLRGIFVGPTGVGKSSLLNALCPSVSLQTRPLNKSKKRGRHTTTVATLHSLKNGGELIDSPGFNDFGLVDISVFDLAFHFPGFEKAREKNCGFRDCLHRSEPGCVVTEMVTQQKISRDRYLIYAEMLHELEALTTELRYREKNKRRKK